MRTAIRSAASYEFYTTGLNVFECTVVYLVSSWFYEIMYDMTRTGGLRVKIRNTRPELRTGDFEAGRAKRDESPRCLFPTFFLFLPRWRESLRLLRWSEVEKCSRFNFVECTQRPIRSPPRVRPRGCEHTRAHTRELSEWERHVGVRYNNPYAYIRARCIVYTIGCLGIFAIVILTTNPCISSERSFS